MPLRGKPPRDAATRAPVMGRGRAGNGRNLFVFLDCCRLLLSGSSAALSATAIAVSAPCRVCGVRRTSVVVAILVPANRLKEDVELETTPQTSSEHGKIKVRRTQNVENRRAWIQQWLHIEKIGRATCLLENPPAYREPFVPKCKGTMVAVQIVRSSGAKHLRLISVDVLSARPRLLVARTKQDLAQLRPSFGTEHHRLTAPEG